MKRALQACTNGARKAHEPDGFRAALSRNASRDAVVARYVFWTGRNVVSSGGRGAWTADSIWFAPRENMATVSDVGGKWLRKPKGQIAAVFVHGFLSGNDAWASAECNWPDLLVAEEDFSEIGVYVFSYRTDVFSGSYTLGDAVEALNTYLRIDRLIDLKGLVFVCHSMGGILTRQWIVTRQSLLVERSVRLGLFLVASPSLGSSYANMLETVAKAVGNIQARTLRFSDDNTWLNDLDRNFMNLKEAGRLAIVGQELVEDKSILIPSIFRRQVVPPFSGAKYFGESIKVPYTDHFTIAKPASRDALQHRLLLEFLTGFASAAASTHPKQTSNAESAGSYARKSDDAPIDTFGIPHPDGYINRRDLELRLQELCAMHPIVSVEGLAGSGKSYLAAHYCETAQLKGDYTDVIWHDGEDGETLDTLLADLSGSIDGSSSSQEYNCKKLMAELSARKTLLVIDDFHKVDFKSYSLLLRIASRCGSPARLLLTSRQAVDLRHGFAQVERVRTQGFDKAEFQRFCEAGGLTIDQDTTERFLLVTDGLPLAALFFVSLLQSGRDAKELLEGEDELSSRLQSWFEQLKNDLPSQVFCLLQALSLSDGPFTLGVVRKFIRQLFGENTLKPFERLERTYFVSSAKLGSWRVHHLIGVFSQRTLKDAERRRFHRSFGEYYEAGLPRFRTVLEVQHLLWKAAACRHYGMAGAFSEAERILAQIVPTVKTLGYYALFIQLYESLFNSRAAEGWTTYHYAHCCFIVGRFSQALTAIDGLRFRIPKEEHALRLAVGRIEAELVDSLGESERALAILDEVLRAIPENCSDERQFAHAKSIEAHLLMACERFAAAEAIVQELLESASAKRNDLGIAVALMRRVQLAEKRSLLRNSAGDILNAVALFRKCRDRRGSSWALMYSALQSARAKRMDDCLRDLVESLDIKDEIGDCSKDYLEVVEKLIVLVNEPDVVARLQREERRLRQFYSL